MKERMLAKYIRPSVIIGALFVNTERIGEALAFPFLPSSTWTDEIEHDSSAGSFLRGHYTMQTDRPAIRASQFETDEPLASALFT